MAPADQADSNLDDLRLVAVAYRRATLAGGGDREGFTAALEAYLDRHPESPSDRAGERVSELIHFASEQAEAWLYGRRDAAPHND